MSSCSRYPFFFKKNKIIIYLNLSNVFVCGLMSVKSDNTTLITIYSFLFLHSNLNLKKKNKEKKNYFEDKIFKIFTNLTKYHYLFVINQIHIENSIYLSQIIYQFLLFSLNILTHFVIFKNSLYQVYDSRYFCFILTMLLNYNKY